MGVSLKNPLSEENKFEKLKESGDDVLIIGPSGSGKGHLAKRLHSESNARSGKKFIHVNSAGVSPTIFESEMFGHLKGSFTGAFQDREGYCGKVRDGDLFLDEIGDLSLELQAKLLVLINDRTYMPVGSSETLSFDGRIIAATNKFLKKEVTNGNFREDLYYRLNNFVLNAKPLCEQKEIIPELVLMFLDNENSNLTFSNPALEYLSRQKWDGNIRQLKNLVRRIVRYSDDNKKAITEDDVILFVEEEYSYEAETSESEHSQNVETMLRGNLQDWIMWFVKNALARHRGNISLTAKKIGVGRKSLERMLNKNENWAFSL